MNVFRLVLLLLFAGSLTLGAQQPQPRGTLYAESDPFNFRLETYASSKVTINAEQAVILLFDYKGTFETSGYVELQELPKGIVLPAKYKARIKIFQGTGRFAFTGEVHSFQIMSRKGNVNFEGRGAFTMGGKGFYRTAKGEIPLYGIATRDIFVPGD
ncbi:MAG: hypothetical protein HUU60_12420 [Armatimonadetes bacterium]|nr:hypothetical protein [Armatimonadota bacterium]